jgi:uncharacterized iron-regulated membrane protein
MKSLSQSQLKRLTAVHGWSGTVLGILLYAVVVTGTVAVFAHEIAEWSVGGARNHAPLSVPLDAKIRPIADSMTKGYLEEIGIWPNARGDLNVFPHAHARNPDSGRIENYGTLFQVDGTTGAVLARNEGFVFTQPAWYEASALEDFLVDLHVQLYVPRPWGLILTGILGLAMMAAGVTGFLMHRHLIRDLFVAARPGNRLVTARDRHVLAASWGLLFAFLLGFTGSFFSFASTVTLPLLSQVAFGGDQHALRETLYEPAVTPDPSPRALADLDAVITRSVALAGAPVRFISIDRYGRADARISVWHMPGQGKLSFVNNVFDGTDGRFLGVKPRVGRQPSTGSALYALIWPLHTGDFAGTLSKAIWVGLGVAMCYVILSGMQLWVRRREDAALWRGFGRAVTITAFGLPFAMTAASYGFFLSRPAGDPFYWTPMGFVLGALACILIGAAASDGAGLMRRFRRLLGAACIGLPVLRMAMGGTGWSDAVVQGQGAVLSFDLMFLAIGVLLVYWAKRPAESLAAAAHHPEPAE